MDFYQIKERIPQKGVIEIYPDFKVGRSKDLMVRGKSFYAIWDEETQMWSTDEYDVQRIVDKDLLEYKDKVASRHDGKIDVKLTSSFASGSWSSFRKYMQNISDNAHQLDEKLTFANTEVKKKDYVSRRLPYPLEKGDISAYEEIIGTLYSEEERAKLEWAIGAVVSGDAKDIQKFIVLYGEAGAGKSTILNIIQRLFNGYYTTFEAKALTSSSNAFSTEVFKSNPLVAIQHDGDLSKIEDNTKLNSIISHEEMTMNEKYKPSYMSRVNCFLFMATNRPVKITDAKSGIIRRLIDVRPTGNKIPSKRYQALMQQVDFELGAIASHCLEVYREMGKNYYSNYRPLDMIFQTDVFFNFVESNFHTFHEQNGVSLSQAYDIYKDYCDEALVDFKLPRHKFREELKNYFETFSDITRVDGKQIRSYYSGFISSKFTVQTPKKEEHMYSLVLDQTESILDDICSEMPAQYASNDIPSQKWESVKTKLKDINTKEVHYLKPEEKHIVIDFDLKDDNGEKSLEKNIEAASKWPATYAEFSKSGSGIHLHYYYDGDVSKLSRVYDDHIEIKVFIGKSSLRRKLTKCNNIPIATINSGLPLKGEKMANFDTIRSENILRNMIKRNINKEFHPNTKTSIDFIYKLLEDAYTSGMIYDVSDLQHEVLVFANNSTNQAPYCVKLVSKMQFKSDKESISSANYTDDRIVFYDVEVYPNLFVVIWKFKGPENQKISMVNPAPHEMEQLLKFKLVGFNCRRYDNHILYARYLGYNNEQLYKLSKKIINNAPNALFREAYNLSYTDIYDFSSEKKSLKKFQIEMGIHHLELELPWDEPVPDEKIPLVIEYCGNDVDSTEAVFEYRKQDFVARLILSELSGLTPNDTTQQHTAKIIFGNDQKPQDKFVYTDLSTIFPGYTYDSGVSTYKGIQTGEGGLVWAVPGMYKNVFLFDIKSQHPTSLIELNAFGPYTKKFEELVDARVSVKDKDYKKAKKALHGVLAKYLDDESQAEDLAYALKIIINTVYGLTSAKFDNKFKDPRNKDNIVAKRGALFMVDLLYAIQAEGYKVVHIKTDSIKILDADEYIIDFLMKFANNYGYTFEHEAIYEKMCLVNDTVYIAKYAWCNKTSKIGKWEAVGTQFQVPYVFKTLFSHEPIVFGDLCEVKSVQVSNTALYLDMNEFDETTHNYRFIGRVGEFCPILPGHGGGLLMRSNGEKYHHVTGTKGYRWLESEMVKILGKEDSIDRNYYAALVDDAVKEISLHGDFESFID